MWRRVSGLLIRRLQRVRHNGCVRADAFRSSEPIPSDGCAGDAGVAAEGWRTATVGVLFLLDLKDEVTEDAMDVKEAEDGGVKKGSDGGEDKFFQSLWVVRRFCCRALAHVANPGRYLKTQSSPISPTQSSV